jgi:hypothetical protein
VASQALATWTGPRTDRVRELQEAHRLVGGGSRGRRWRTGQLNRALVLCLAGEFQGYCRDLHDQAVDHFVQATSGNNPALAAVQRALVTSNRDLDRGNANPGNLGKDFGHFGLGLWDAVRTVEPTKGPAWNTSLASLNEARNAIAHAQDGRLAALATAGFPIWLQTIKQWHTALDGLAATMDDVVADYLDGLLGTGRPW